jgi:hypothetical protein
VRARGAVGEELAPCGNEVVREPAVLGELASEHGTARAWDDDFVVVAGALPPSSNAVALSRNVRAVLSASASRPLSVRTTSSAYRIASVRCRAIARTTVARWAERSAPRRETAKLNAENDANTSTSAITGARRRCANGWKRCEGTTTPP